MFVDRGIGDAVVQQAVVADATTRVPVRRGLRAHLEGVVGRREVARVTGERRVVHEHAGGVDAAGDARLRAVLVEGDGQRERHPRRTHAAPGTRLQR